MKRTINGSMLLLVLLAPALAACAGEGNQAVVVFNSRMPESRELAMYYARRREVPANQVFGLELPSTETVSRADFREQLQKPLAEALARENLLTFEAGTASAPGRVATARIRYLVLCYGVPVRIPADPALAEPDMDKLPAQIRRNEAAVDSELAVLPVQLLKPRLTGPMANPFFATTNGAILCASNNVLIVGRLDGPSVEIARGLVDKAMQAETNGLWGRAYFDVRGLAATNSYRPGDDWIRGASVVCRQTGFETVVDEKPETFPASFPMSQIAFYAGWYDGQVSGPFTRPGVEFMPGAVAYHLHSFSAHVLRSANQYWAGPLLAKGATATMGCVDEPYLEGTPNLAVFWSRFIGLGFSFGEAALAAQQTLSWQTTVVGDPLYRPFARKPPGAPVGKCLQELHLRLLAEKSPLIAWSHLQVANLNLVMGYPASDVIGYLQQEPTTLTSPVLMEKLGDVLDANGKLSGSIEAYRKTLKLDPSPQQRVRVTLVLARALASYQEEAEALGLYRTFLDGNPGYPDRLTICKRALILAKGLKDKAEIEKLNAEIQRLAPAK